MVWVDGRKGIEWPSDMVAFGMLPGLSGGISLFKKIDTA
jgi:hypothetical protein